MVCRGRRTIGTGRRVPRPAVSHPGRGHSDLYHRRMEYVPELTGLRALAVFLAISEHTSIPGLRGGWIGVDVFFVLSGYLITSILVAEWRRTDAIALGRFYLKRALRLYPALLLMLALGAIFYRFLGDDGSLLGYGRTVVLGATYTEDFALGLFGRPYGQLGHTWSLAVEEQFYLIWAPVLLLLLKFRQRPIPWLCGFIAIGWTSLVLSTTQMADPPNTYYRPDTRMSELFLGCLIAFLMERFRESLKNYRPVRILLGPAALAGILYLESYSNSHGRLLTFPQQEISAGLLAGLLLVGLLVAGPAAPLNRVLRLRPIVWLGTISYGLYIYFIPVFVLLEIFFHHQGWNDSSSLLLVTQFAVVLAMASLSYYLVEKRFLALKDRISARGPRRRPQHARGRSRPVPLPAPRLPNDVVTDRNADLRTEVPG
jgi:peptidoglycan/LPS O-acetylase OafA/YrhL